MPNNTPRPGSTVARIAEADSDLTPVRPIPANPHCADSPALNFSDNLVLYEQTAGALRSFLKANGLHHWHCFHVNDEDDPSEFEDYLEQLGEDAATWVPFHPFTPGGCHSSLYRSCSSKEPSLDVPGCLWLRKHQVVIGRYFTRCDLPDDWAARYVYAASSPDCFERFATKLRKFRRDANMPCWQRYGSRWFGDDLPRATDLGWNDLILPAVLRRRLQTEVLDFFTDDVARLYRELKISYRRGVLLHGPPGNGKTSIIRAMGAELLKAEAMLLRPGGGFDEDDFVRIIRIWRKSAPALLVIEDLDWLLNRVNLSTFLNEIDGIDSFGGGLLLIATTNCPGSLDPALNNRPGRFDVVVEVPSPCEAQRLDFLRGTALAGMEAALLRDVAAGTDGLSFAHLREIVSLSGLSAVRDGRPRRGEKDVREAMRVVCDAHADAQRGFPGRKKHFGLTLVRKAD